MKMSKRGNAKMIQKKGDKAMTARHAYKGKKSHKFGGKS